MEDPSVDRLRDHHAQMGEAIDWARERLASVSDESKAAFVDAVNRVPADIDDLPPLTQEQIDRAHLNAERWARRVPDAPPPHPGLLKVHKVIEAWRALHAPGLLRQVAVLHVRTMAPELAAALDKLAGVNNG